MMNINLFILMYVSLNNDFGKRTKKTHFYVSFLYLNDMAIILLLHYHYIISTLLLKNRFGNKYMVKCNSNLVYRYDGGKNLKVILSYI